MMTNGHVYAVSFTSADATGVTKDIFDITGSTKSNFVVHALYLAQIAAALTSSAIEAVPIGVYRGSTLASAGGATSIPRKLDGRSSATATFSVLINSSSPGSSGPAAQLLHSMPWNTQTAFVWKPAPEDRPTCRLSQRLQVRLGATASTVTIGGTLIVEEIGKIPGSAVA